MNQTKSLSTYDCIETLTKSGVPEQQAKAHVKTMNQTMQHYVDNILATKHDLNCVEINLRCELDLKTQELRHEMHMLRKDLQQDMKDLENKFDLFRIEVQSEFKTMHWMMGVLASGVGSLMIKTFIF
jgi:DNA-binding SARP family transcriptional activator